MGINKVNRASTFRRLMLLAVVAGNSQAAGLQSLDAIRTVAEQAIAARLQTNDRTTHIYIQAGTLDPRLRLPACAATPQGFLPDGVSVAARTTVGVRCATPLWSVYVPVTVESELSVLVLKTAAARNTQLRPEDVQLQKRRVPGFPASYLTDVATLGGRHLKSAAGPGALLTTELLAQDILVRRGQRVTLLAAAGGIEVRALGEAVSDATAAGRVKVQNLNSRRIVEGQVETADRVRISP